MEPAILLWIVGSPDNPYELANHWYFISWIGMLGYPPKAVFADIIGNCKDATALVENYGLTIVDCKGVCVSVGKVQVSFSFDAALVVQPAMKILVCVFERNSRSNNSLIA